MAAPGAASQTTAGGAEYRFIGSYIKGDIKKDHPKGFLEGIANRIIPPLAQDAQVMGKEELLDSLIKLSVDGQQERNANIYKTLQDLPVDTTGTIDLKLFNPDCTYTFQVFNRDNDDVNKELIQRVTRGRRDPDISIILTSDTSNHTDLILTPQISQKYSRESEWDPAQRSQVGKCLEDYRSNATGVLYPSFHVTDKLSYLFLNYNIYLVHKNGKVHLEYINTEGRPQEVDGDSNKAGLALVIYEKAIGCLIADVTTVIRPDKIESRYVGKYCGDGCLRISQFRNTLLNQGAGGGAGACKRTTFDYDMQLNETYDGNYLTGLLAAQSDAIWYHTNDKERLIVFSKEIHMETYYQEKFAMLLEKLKKDLKTFNENNEKYTKLLSDLGKDINNFKTYFNDYRLVGKSYVDVLKDFTNYSILYKKCLELQRKYSNIQTTINEMNAVTAEEGLLVIAGVQMSIEDTKEYLDKIRPFLKLEHDLRWKGVLFKSDSTLQDVTIEDLVIRKIIGSHGVGWKVTYESVFKAVDPDATSSPTLASRVTRLFTSKTPSSWGLDIVKKVYTILEEIDPTAGGSAGGSAGGATSVRKSLSHTFIDKLKDTLKTKAKKTEFVSLLGNIGITYTGLQTGGAYLHKKTYKSKKRLRKTRKIYKQHGGMTSTVFKTELETHLTFLKKIFRSNDTSEETTKSIFENHFNPYVENTPLSSGASGGLLMLANVAMEANSPNSPQIVLDPLEFYEAVLTPTNPAIITLLNSYKIMHYVDKNDLNDLQNSIIRQPTTLQPDSIESINNLHKNIIRICHTDISSSEDFEARCEEIDNNIKEAYRIVNTPANYIVPSTPSAGRAGAAPASQSTIQDSDPRFIHNSQNQFQQSVPVNLLGAFGSTMNESPSGGETNRPAKKRRVSSGGETGGGAGGEPGGGASAVAAIARQSPVTVSSLDMSNGPPRRKTQRKPRR